MSCGHTIQEQVAVTSDIIFLSRGEGSMSHHILGQNTAIHTED